jgi:hypothetical protein
MAADRIRLRARSVAAPAGVIWVLDRQARSPSSPTAGRAPVRYTVGFFGFFGFGGRFGVLSPMCHLLCGV